MIHSSQTNTVNTTSIEFSDIQFKWQYTAGSTATVFFSTARHQNSILSPATNVTIRFHNFKVLGENLEALPIVGQSAPLSFLETYADPFIYPSTYSSGAIITELSFDSGYVYDIGKLLRSEPTLHTFDIRDVQFHQMTNGWMRLITQNAYLGELSCNDCLPDSFDYTILRVQGIGGDSDSYARNLRFNSTVFRDNVGLTDAFNFIGFDAMEFENLESERMVGWGIQFSALANLPCNRNSLSTMKIANPNAFGTVADIRCFAPEISCTGDECLSDPGYIPPWCLVDPNVPVFGGAYRVQFFRKVADAALNCKARNERQEKIIYIKSGVYSENNIVFPNYNTTEHIIIQSVNGTAYIHGTGHVLQPRVGRVYVKYTFTDLVFFNPLGVSGAYSAVLSDYFISNPGLPVSDIHVERCEFIAIKPLNLFVTIPTTTNQWIAFRTALLDSSGLIHPYIRDVSVATALRVSVLGTSNYTDVSFYGSAASALVDDKSVSGSNNMDLYSSTTVIRVKGENTFGGLLELISSKNQTIVREVRCNYFCGGYSTLSSSAVVKIDVDSSTGKTFVMEDIDVRDLQPQVIGNNYTSASRVSYGDPFLDGAEQPVGYVTGISINGLQGTSWNTVRIRTIQTSGLPGGGRCTNCDRTNALALNDAGPVLWNDGRTILRELQRSNSPSLSIRGYRFDLRSNILILDNSLNPNLVCNGICPISTNSILCRVGASLTPSLTDYTRGNAALQFCPFNRIVFVDPVHVENLSWNMLSARINSPTGILDIGTTVNTRLIGHHTFTATCPSNPSVEFQPESIRFRYLRFENTPSQNNESIIEFNSTTGIVGSCSGTIPHTTVQFQNNDFLLKHAANTTAIQRVFSIRCNQCDASLWSVDTQNIFRAESNVVYRWNAIQFEPRTDIPLHIAPRRLVVDTASIQNSPQYAILSINAATFYYNVLSLECQDSGDSCIYIYGSQPYTGNNITLSSYVARDITISKQTDSIGGSNSKWAGIRWDHGRDITSLAEASQYQTNFDSISALGAPSGILMTFTNWHQLAQPCTSIGAIYIRPVSIRNPNADNLPYGIAWADTTLSTFNLPLIQLNCTICIDGCPGVTTSDNLPTIVLWVTIGVIIVALFVIAATGFYDLGIVFPLFIGGSRKPSSSGYDDNDYDDGDSDGYSSIPLEDPGN
jgi:hypothetical protein